MALVNDGFELDVVLGGIDDSTQTRNYQFDSSVTTYAEAVTATGTVLTALAAVSDGAVKSYVIKARSVEDAYNRPSVATAERGDGAIVSGEIDGNPLKAYVFTVPYPKTSIFLATAGKNYNVVDIADTDLLAYKNLFSAAGVCTISDGEKAGNMVSGKRA